MAVTIHTAEDIAQMRVACRLASEVLDYITPFVVPGVTTGKLDQLATPTCVTCKAPCRHR
jgi:methionyl aminopeptidase